MTPAGGGPAPIIVTALFGRQDQGWFDAERQRHFPSERNQLAAHLTIALITGVPAVEPGRSVGINLAVQEAWEIPAYGKSSM